MKTSQRYLLITALGIMAVVLTIFLVPLNQEQESGWIRSPKNPMLTLGSRDDFDSQNIMSPAIARDTSGYFLFYAGGPAGPLTKEDYVRYQLGLALSEDGEKWAKLGRPLLPLGKRDNFHATPALLRTPAGDLHKKDGLWHLLFCGNRADDIEHATSRNGLTWKKDPRNPVYKGAYSPNLVQVGEEIWMYYVHKPTNSAGGEMPWEIHLATGPDFYSLRAHHTNPLLKISQPWEDKNLFYPYVLMEGNTCFMFYASYWKGNPHSTAIGMATSSDGLNWTKSDDNPVLTPMPGSFYDSKYTSAQAVIRDGDHYKMYYGSRINMVHKYYAIGLVTYHGMLASP